MGGMPVISLVNIRSNLYFYLILVYVVFTKLEKIPTLTG